VALGVGLSASSKPGGVATAVAPTGTGGALAAGAAVTSLDAEGRRAYHLQAQDELVERAAFNFCA